MVTTYGSYATLLTLDEIEATIAANNTTVEQSALSTFQEITWILGVRNDFSAYLSDALKTLEPILPIAESLDNLHKDVWQNWRKTVQSVLNIIQENSSAQTSFLNEKKVKPKKASNLTFWLTELNEKSPSGLLAAKAICLIGRHERYIEEEVGFAERFHLFSRDDEEFLTNTIRKCFTGEWKHLEVAKEYLPDWPSSSPAEWKKTFIERANKAPYYRNSKYPDKHEFLHTMAVILRHVSSHEELDTNHVQNTNSDLRKKLILILRKLAVLKEQLTFKTDLPQTSSTQDLIDEPPLPDKEAPSIVNWTSRARSMRPNGKRFSKRPAFDYINKSVPSENAVLVALSPDVLHIEPQQDTPADEPMQLAAVQSIKVRYSNYRSFMDNQRLPWAWDRLNIFEITSLNQALNHGTSHTTSLQEKQGAFIVWLLMTTGQSIERILTFSTAPSGNTGCLLPGPTYRRYFPTPPSAFRPSKEEKNKLSTHSDYIDLPLTPPFPLLFSELGLIDQKIKPIVSHQTIGTLLKLNQNDAEAASRQFLEAHRTREFRLLPGKIRNILSTEVMRVSNDPVATHLLTALPTDMPPSGIYYTAYTPEVLRNIFQAAISRIIGGNS